MTVGRVAVLRPGDWVSFAGGEHQVVAVAGTSVRLRSGDGLEQVVLGTHLMAAPGFAVIDGALLPAIEPFGLLDGLPPAVVEEARDWERHLVEVETGLSPNPPDGAEPHRGFDPAVTTLAERARAKAAELGVSLRTVQNRRARYRGHGLWGLVDQRAARDNTATGRVDARLVAAIREVVGAETDTSTGTRSLRGVDATGAWTLPELQDLLDEWLLAGWQPRPHDALRDPLAPRRMLSPNEKYAALVAAAGYLPLTLSGEDYPELLPAQWRAINAYGIRIGYRTNRPCSRWCRVVCSSAHSVQSPPSPRRSRYDAR